jgi:BirA family biotin operon repressor/biotin-[acetyl-CoA-carboxylase] ligase
MHNNNDEKDYTAVNWTIDHLDETDSTNGWLREHRTEADRVVWADYQTAGRGCGTNSWESERGQNLLFSVLIHPVEVRASDQFILSMANALALRDTIASYVDDVKIKWPNDIYWKDSKICGTLIETTLKGQYVKDCIIGTGINVNQTLFLSDAPNPVSLRQILGHDTDCREVLQKVLDSFTKYMEMVGAGPVPAHEHANWETIRKDYRDHLYRRDETWPYRFADGGVKECRLVNVTDDGHLELVHDNSEVYRLAFKEVQFVLAP